MRRKAKWCMALCAMAVLACAGVLAVVFRLTDADRLGSTGTQQPAAPTQADDGDFYLLRQLCVRGGSYIRPQDEGSLYVPGTDIVDEMPCDATLNKEAIRCFDTLVEQGILADGWRQAALQNWEEGYGVEYNNKFYDTASTYYTSDSLGFLELLRLEANGDATELHNRFALTVDSRTGAIISVWILSEQPYALPDAQALAAFAAQAGLADLGDWAPSEDPRYPNALYSTRGQALVNAAVHPYTDNAGTPWYYLSLTLTAYAGLADAAEESGQGAFPVGTLRPTLEDTPWEYDGRWYRNMTLGPAMTETFEQTWSEQEAERLRSSSCCLVMELDPTAMQERPACHVPGCAHNTPGCSALQIVEGTRGPSAIVGEELILLSGGTLERRNLNTGERTAVAVDFGMDGSDIRYVLADEFAFYGMQGQNVLPYSAGTPQRINRQLRGIRVGFDGTVQHFAISEAEEWLGMVGDRILINSCQPDEPMYAYRFYHQREAAMQNAAPKVELLNPATGERQPLMEGIPFGSGHISSCGVWGEELLLFAEPYASGPEPKWAQRIFACNTKTGEIRTIWQDESEVPHDDWFVAGSTWLPGPQGHPCLPICKYENGAKEVLLDLVSGEVQPLPANPAEREGYWQFYGAAADGRWLTTYGERFENGNYRMIFGLADPQALLEGRTDCEVFESCPIG